MTPEQRKEAASKAALAKAELARLPKATHQGDLRIGDATLQCYVLADGTRVLTQEGFLTAMGRAGKAKGGHGASAVEMMVDKVPSFLSAGNLKPFISNDLIESTTPIVFRTPSNSRAFGYRAELLPKVCRVYLEARDAKATTPAQSHVVRSADLLTRGLAQVGIIALVDEATGYQRDRAKDALAEILEAYIAKELQPWVKTFDSRFYEGMFRLRGLPYPPETRNLRPQYFGKLTNDIVYSRLAPGVLEALKKEGAAAEKKGKLHQHLTAGYGRQELLKHLGSVTTMMLLSSDWPDFMTKLNRICPRIGTTYEMALEEVDR
jgi:hypothetical protein